MDEWVVKGEGNANIVFEYVGGRPELVGEVRKGSSTFAPSAATQAA